MAASLLSNTGRIIGNLSKLKLCCSVPLLLAGSLLMTGCGDAPTDSTVDAANSANTLADSDNPAVLTVLAGSELKDIEPFLPDIKQHTGIELKLNYTGTLDGVNAISQGANADTAWFSHGKYLSLVNRDKIKAQTPIMLSPVVMGVKQSKAEALGWLTDSGAVKPNITWGTIADAAKSGKLKYAMTNPAASNSGFTALMGVTSAFSGSTDAPTAEDIAIAKPKLKDFFRGQGLTSGSSGWLADAYVDEQDQLDAIINYESVLMQLNQSKRLREPLVLVFPTEGIVTADYPFTLLNFAKKDSYDKVVDYLKSAPMQQRLMQDTHRRPVNTEVALTDNFYSGLLVELPFPNSRQLIDALLVDFANELRNPAYSVFVLDTSGSMRGEGIAQLKGALLDLTGQNATATPNTPASLGSATAGNQFTKFSKNEVVGLQPFSNITYELQIYPIDDNNLAKLRHDIDTLTPKGGTAIYSALQQGYQSIYQQRQKNEARHPQSAQDAPPYYYSIVLMTDGNNEDGISYQDFEAAYRQMPAAQQNIKTFVVLFGDADESEMQQVAQLTGGKVFDGRHSNLTAVFREIRGYQ